jgi:hypothetical protein
MAFTNVVSLAEAKQYLRVDDGFTADDSLITLLINVAGDYVERHTNHRLYAREKTYKFFDGCVRVYDYPINSITSPPEADMEITEASLYTLYEYSSGDLVLNVGYADVANVPAMLKAKMLDIIDAMYNGNENDSITSFDDSLMDSLARWRRFTI